MGARRRSPAVPACLVAAALLGAPVAAQETAVASRVAERPGEDGGAEILPVGAARTGQPGPERDDAAGLAQRWFRALQDLDATEARRNAFLALYAEDALHIQGPSGDHQRGTTTFWGREKVGLLVDRLLTEWENHSIRIEVATAAEISTTLLPETPGPWGGPLVAAQFAIAGTSRKTGLRWHVPGAVFFRIADGELVRVRVYLGLGEAAEVEIQ